MPAGVTLFLDLDGPILETSLRHFEVHRQLVAEQGATTRLTAEELWRRKRAGQSSAQIFAEEHPAGDAARFRQRWIEEIESPRGLTFDQVQPGATEWLSRLARQFPLVLVTLRQDRDGLAAQLRHLALASFFSQVLSADPRPGDGAARKAQLIAVQSWAAGLMVGDTEVDIRAGKQVGLATVALACGIRDAAFLAAEQPNLLLPNLAALTLEAIASLTSQVPIRRLHVR